MLSPSIRPVLVSTALLLALAPAVRPGPGEPSPASGQGTDLVERAEARLVQVDVSGQGGGRHPPPEAPAGLQEPPHAGGGRSAPRGGRATAGVTLRREGLFDAYA